MLLSKDEHATVMAQLSGLANQDWPRPCPVSTGVPNKKLRLANGARFALMESIIELDVMFTILSLGLLLETSCWKFQEATRVTYHLVIQVPREP